MNKLDGVGNRFFVLTTGRAGSTSLMDALGSHPDIATPSKQIDCPNNEIFQVVKPDRYWETYARLSGVPVVDELSLARAFFCSNSASFAGFKTMPNRHRRLQQMITDNGIQVIGLIRRDLSSTIASFIAAVDAKSWQRSGEHQRYHFRFSSAIEARVDAHLVYLLTSLRQLKKLRDTIMIEFEDLCTETFCHHSLNNYFQRPIRLHDPRQPIDGATYVENWTEFTRYVQRRVGDFQRQHPSS
ncbi:MAG: hypothetical protein ACI9BW_004190 [Gammaproteobacteria bacterium]|jgi:hypothetical protein